MGVKRIFPHEDIGYDDYLKTVKSVMDSKVIFCSKSCVEIGVNSLTKVVGEEQQKRLISSSISMDKAIDESRRSLKVPIVLTLANFIANYYDKVRRLNDDELVMLGMFSCFVEPEYMEQHLELFADKELLKSAMSKTSIHDEQIAILSVIDNKYYEFLNDKENKDGLEQFKKDSVSFVKNNSKDELLQMVKPIEETIKELEEKGIYFY